MKRRTFLKAATGSLLLPQLASARIPAHNWNSCDFGTGPTAKDRLYQGSFPQYGPEAFIPDSEVVMTTTASKEIVPNFGMGLTVYVSGDYWPMRRGGNSVEKYLEDLIKIPFVQKVYIRLNWCNIQSQPDRLEFPEAWKQAFAIAKKYGKRVAFRMMLENSDYPDPGMPKFLLEKVPYVTLKGEWRTKDRNYPKGFKMPFPRTRPPNSMKCSRMNSTVIRTSNTSMRSCTAFGAKGIHGRSPVTLSRTTQLPKRRGSKCSKFSCSAGRRHRSRRTRNRIGAASAIPSSSRAPFVPTTGCAPIPFSSRTSKSRRSATAHRGSRPSAKSA